MSKPSRSFEMINVDDQDKDLLALVRLVSKTHIAARTAYVQLKRENGKTQYLHRTVMERVIGRKLARSEKIDHINGDGLDCRRRNLRIASHSANLANRPGWRKASSQYKGVTWNKARSIWEAKIMKNYKTTYLGCFTDESEAARAYDVVAMRLFGEYARPNFGLSPCSNS
jgi:hypothetical protein